jgi:hypothetical protein
MNFTQAKKLAGTPLAEIEKQKQAALRDFRRECAEAEQIGQAAIKIFDQLNLNAIKPFISEIEGAGIHDNEVARFVFDLKELTKKPQELHEHLGSLRAVTWEQLSSPPYKDRVDEGKRAALVRHYTAKLSKFGDVEGTARILIQQTRERIIELASAAERNGGEFVEMDVPVKDVSPEHF